MVRLANSSFKVFWVVCIINLGMAVSYGFAAPTPAFVNGHESPIYTLLTTHFTHHSAKHLCCNMLALWLLLILFPNKTFTLVSSFTVCILLVAIYALLAEIEMFLGFSALLYCLPGCYFAKSIADKNLHISIGILMILYLYLFMIVPMTTDENDFWAPMTSAHVLGFIAGLVTAFFHTDKRTQIWAQDYIQ